MTDSDNSGPMADGQKMIRLLRAGCYLLSAVCYLTSGRALAADAPLDPSNPTVAESSTTDQQVAPPGSPAEKNPSRLFFGDAFISFVFPKNWELQPQFPYGPLFRKITRDSGQAFIAAVISQPMSENHIGADISSSTLRSIALEELQAHQQGLHLMGERRSNLAGHNAYEIIWQNGTDDPVQTHESAFFYLNDRIYVFTLEAPPNDLRWIQPDFEGWASTLQTLSRKNSGALDVPAHGGLWLNQTAGVKVMIPVNWLIAVADDQTLGATLAAANLHTDFTATLDLTKKSGKELSGSEKRQARKAILKKGLRITEESEDAFHGYPAFRLKYAGRTMDDRVIKGEDIWVSSPKARWLFNIEGDAALFDNRAQDYDQILGIVQFL